jgi:hypothetical protein
MVKTQAQKRKERRQKKTLERNKDTTGVRGFSTDQRITIESINVNKQTLKHLQNESQMVALGLQETAIRAQLTHAQTMAERQCPKYNRSNMFWKRADALQLRHKESIAAIMNATSNVGKKDPKEDTDVNLSEFLLQESPQKKRSFKDMVGNKECKVVEDLEFEGDNDDGSSLSCKVEKMSAAAVQSSVSHCKKKKKRIF